MNFSMLPEENPLAPLPPEPGWRGLIKGWWRNYQAQRVTREVRSRLETATEDVKKAREQGALVALSFQSMGLYNNVGNNLAEKTTLTFEFMRMMAHTCEPIAAIHETRIQQVSQFAHPAITRRGRAMSPGFRVRLTNPDEPATEEDKRRCAELEQFLYETGYTEPPELDKPINYQRGFEPFLRQLVRDSLCFDWAVIKRWPSKINPKRYPIVSFCAYDSARIRRTLRIPMGVRDGEPVYSDYQPQRTNLEKGQRIEYVELEVPEPGARIVAEYTKDDLAVWVRNPVTDINLNGYGYSEIERLTNAITIWLYGRGYNASRFREDSLPRGMLLLLGNITEEQLQSFRLQWRAQFEGAEKRWKIPILRGMPQQGASIQWIDLDRSSRDMEYHQFMFMVALWAHAIYKIHPEETGWEALSPYSPPLSEASPEAKLKQSKDLGLGPLLRGIQTFINREIIWKLVPNRRYCFEFVGLGDYDEYQDIQMRLARLQAGLSTPRMEWAELDLPIPEAFANHKAWDFPAPLFQGMQYLDQIEQQKQQMAQAQMMAQQQQGQGGAGGGAPGGEGGPPQAGGGGGLGALLSSLGVGPGAKGEEEGSAAKQEKRRSQLQGLEKTEDKRKELLAQRRGIRKSAPHLRQAQSNKPQMRPSALKAFRALLSMKDLKHLEGAPESRDVPVLSRYHLGKKAVEKPEHPDALLYESILRDFFGPPSALSKATQGPPLEPEQPMQDPLITQRKREKHNDILLLSREAGTERARGYRKTIREPMPNSKSSPDEDLQRLAELAEEGIEAPELVNPKTKKRLSQGRKRLGAPAETTATDKPVPPPEGIENPEF